MKQAKQKSLISNTIWAYILQGSAFIFPLITMPYVSEILGAEILGRVNFSTAVAGIFGVFALVGTATYGVKEVAKIKDNPEAVSKFLSEMIIIKFVATIGVMIVYIPVISAVPQFSKEFYLFLLQGAGIIIGLFSIDWLFQGLEDYRYIAIRTLTFRAIGVAAIFLFIKTGNDYFIYALISVLSSTLANLLNIIYAKTHLPKRKEKLEYKKHFSGLSVFFMSAVVISIYTMLDQVLLGFFIGDEEVALFVRAKTFLSLGMTMAVAFNGAILPKINYVFEKDKQSYIKLLDFSFNILLLLILPIMLGTILLSADLMILFGGGTFARATPILMLIAPLVFFVPVGTWGYSQRLIPLKKEHVGLAFQIMMACISLILNLILIPLYGLWGIAISYLAAETMGTVVGLIYSFRFDKYNIFKLYHIKLVLATVVMTALLLFLNYILPQTWLFLAIKIFAGVGAYFATLFVLKEQAVWMVIRKIFKKEKQA